MDFQLTEEMSYTELCTLVFTACNRLNNRDLVTMVISSELLEDAHYRSIESYEEFKGFTIIDSGIDSDGREAIFMLYNDDVRLSVTLERVSSNWRVLTVANREVK